MKLSDCDPKLRQRILEADRQQNARTVGGLPAAKRKRDDERQPKGSNANEKRGAICVVVSIVAFRKRLLDDDNMVFGCKWLRDSIAKTIGLDDADKRLRFEYSQAFTSGEEGCVVKIEVRNCASKAILRARDNKTEI